MSTRPEILVTPDVKTTAEPVQSITSKSNRQEHDTEVKYSGRPALIVAENKSKTGMQGGAWPWKAPMAQVASAIPATKGAKLRPKSETKMTRPTRFIPYFYLLLNHALPRQTDRLSSFGFSLGGQVPTARSSLHSSRSVKYCFYRFYNQQNKRASPCDYHQVMCKKKPGYGIIQSRTQRDQTMCQQFRQTRLRWC